MLLQKESEILEIGDPSLLLDENFELSPKNYSKLLEYTKMTAQRLNEVISQSSEIFSKYLGLSEKLEHISIEEIPKLSQCKSVDSNSTKDSDRIHQRNHISKQFHTSSHDSSSQMTNVWESGNDPLLAKLVRKYHKDWKKIAKAFSLNYQLNYKPEFLRARYSQMMKQEEVRTKSRKILQSFENNEMNEEWENYEGTKKIKIENTKPSESYEESHLLLTPPFSESDQCELLKDSEKESFKLFFTKNEQLESKTVELPWIGFDYNKDFGQEDELFERVTSCYN